MPGRVFVGRGRSWLFVATVLVGMATLSGGCVEEEEGPQYPRFLAMSGEGGVALYLAEFELQEAVIEAVDDGGNPRTLEVGGAGLVVDTAGTDATGYTLRDDDGEVVATVDALPLTVEFMVGDIALVDPDAPMDVYLAFGYHPLKLVPGDILNWRQVLPSGDREYLDWECGTGVEPECWGPDLVVRQAGVRLQELLYPSAFLVVPFSPDLPVPTSLDTGQFFRITDPHSGDAILAGGAVRSVLLETDLRWGDPHAHSNLSHDGCEDIYNLCGHQGEAPGEDFFANAVAAELDFAAITDHAEWDEITSPTAEPVPIWSATQQLVAAAEAEYGPDFVPLLGHEWTHFVPVFGVLDPGEDPDPYADEFTAGHKTVLLGGTAACDAYRIAAPTTLETYAKGNSGLEYVQTGAHPLADKAPALFEALDEAGQQCGAQEVLTFFHHPAILLPNPVNWALEVNEPDAHYERLVEIASEQGSAECRDITDDGCAFWINDTYNNFHVQWGSVQEALSQGYRLGFTGGTDCHDGRPGSQDDGPSWLALYGDIDGDGTEDGPLQQSYPGAITGVWCQDSWSRTALWEALTARRTLATTGPRGAVGAVALGGDGTPYLPGEEIPASAFPIRVLASFDLEADAVLESVELVEPDGGTVVVQTTLDDLDELVEDPGSPALYLRARVSMVPDEHRIWISPWFIDREN